MMDCVSTEDGSTRAALASHDSAKKRLIESYERHLDESEAWEFVLISGPSGVGKTSLAKSLDPVVRQGGGQMIYGKFDQLAHSYCDTSTSLYGPFVDAFTKFIDAVMEAGEDAVKSVRATLEAAMGVTERQVLHDMIPALGRILRIPKLGSFSQRSPVIKGPDAESRFVRVFCNFVQAMCSTTTVAGKAIVLCLDDLQWASQCDLDLLQSLAEMSKGSTNSRLMLLCTCRSDENAVEKPWFSTVKNMRVQGIAVNEINVTNTSREEVCGMLSRALDLPIRNVEPFSKLVHDHTGGNVLFVNMILTEIKQSDTLCINPCTDVDTFQTFLTQHCQSIEALILQRIQRLPNNVQTLLKVASCLGSKLSAEHLSIGGAIAHHQVVSAIVIMTDAGIVSFDHKLNSGHFAHDRFQQAAYQLIPENERDAWHLGIGRRLWDSLPRTSRNDSLLLIGHQISRGAHLITIPEEKTRAAEILSRAGQKAALSSAFTTAASFLHLGIWLLGQGRWFRTYELCLQLCSFAAEIEYYNGNLKRVDELVAEVLHHGRTFEDKLRAYFTKVYALGSRNEMVQALDESMEVLRNLGEKFPRKPGVGNIVAGLIRCNCMLRGKSDDDILSLPEIRDQKKLAGMRLISGAGLFAFYTREKLLPLLAFRLISNTLRSGMSDIACAGFAMWAHICAYQGDVSKACRFSRLALRMMKKYESKEWQTRIVLTVYSAVYPLKHPYKKLLGPLKDAHRVGLVVGDLHFSMVSAAIYTDFLYFAGLPLETIVEDLRRYQATCRQYKQLSALIAVEIHLQFCLNLMGKSSNVLILTGEAMNEENKVATMKDKNPLEFAYMTVLRLTLAIYMNNLPAAQEISRELRHLRDPQAAALLSSCLLVF